MKPDAPIRLGVDLAKAKLDAALILPPGQLHQRTFTNDPTGWAELSEWLEQLGVGALHAGMEATGSYWLGLALHLYQRGDRVSVINPAYIKAHAQACGLRSKTDRVDARLIADYLAKHDCELWQPLPAELEELRELMRLHADVQALCTSASQRAEGLRTPLARQLQAQLSCWLKDFTQRVLQAARQHARQHPTLAQPVRRLQTIPGIGEVTALRLTSELPRATSARSVAAWAGLTPRQHDSGSSVHRRPRLSKQGSEYVRQSLYWPAITALRCCPAMQAFGQRLAEAKLEKMQIIGAAMHKLLRWSVGVLRTNQDFDPTLHAPA